MNAPRIAIGKVIADVSASTLRFYRQIGVEAVTMPSRWNVRVTPTRPHIPPTQRGPAPAQPPPWDRALLARIKERIEAFDLAVGAINLPVSGNILMGLPGRDADIEAMRDEYDGRRRYLLEGFRRIGLPCFEPKGAFYVFPDITGSGLCSEEFCERFLLEEKVAVISGTAFGPSGEGFVRCCYAASMQDLAESLRRLERFLEKTRKR